MLWRFAAVAIILILAPTRPSYSGYEVLWSGETVNWCTNQSQTEPPLCKGDFDADGRMEFVVLNATFPFIRIVDAMSGIEEGTLPGIGACRFESIDLDKDGSPEIIAHNGNIGFSVIDYVGTSSVPVAGSAASDVATVHPNPLNPSATIDYVLPARGKANIQIYDVAGRSVRTLLDGVAEPGQRSVVWDGRADDGQQLPSGSYFYSLTLDGKTLDKGKAVILK